MKAVAPFSRKRIIYWASCERPKWGKQQTSATQGLRACTFGFATLHMCMGICIFVMVVLNEIHLQRHQEPFWSSLGHQVLLYNCVRLVLPAPLRHNRL